MAWESITPQTSQYILTSITSFTTLKSEKERIWIAKRNGSVLVSNSALLCNVVGCIHHNSGLKIPKKLWGRDTNTIAETIEVGDYDCVLLFAVDQENSPEGAYRKYKEFMKNTERNGGVRIGDLDAEGLESHKELCRFRKSHPNMCLSAVKIILSIGNWDLAVWKETSALPLTV